MMAKQMIIKTKYKLGQEGYAIKIKWEILLGKFVSDKEIIFGKILKRGISILDEPDKESIQIFYNLNNLNDWINEENLVFFKTKEEAETYIKERIDGKI